MRPCGAGACTHSLFVCLSRHWPRAKRLQTAFWPPLSFRILPRYCALSLRHPDRLLSLAAVGRIVQWGLESGRIKPCSFYCRRAGEIHWCGARRSDG